MISSPLYAFLDNSKIPISYCPSDFIPFRYRGWNLEAFLRHFWKNCQFVFIGRKGNTDVAQRRQLEASSNRVGPSQNPHVIFCTDRPAPPCRHCVYSTAFTKTDDEPKGNVKHMGSPPSHARATRCPPQWAFRVLIFSFHANLISGND